MVRDGIWGSETISETGRGGQKTKRREKQKKSRIETLLISGCSSSLRFTFFSYFLVYTVSEMKTGSCPLPEQKTEDTLAPALKSAAEEKLRSRGRIAVKLSENKNTTLQKHLI